MSFYYRAGMLGLALSTIVQVAGTNAQTIPVMGYVAAKNANPKRLETFKKGLAELGYVEGKNIRIEYREAVLDAEYNGVMNELVDRKIEIIVAANVAATRAIEGPSNVLNRAASRPFPSSANAAIAARSSARPQQNAMLRGEPIKFRFGPLCGLKSDISRGPRSATCRHCSAVIGRSEIGQFRKSLGP
jgi:hypothetical protein